MPIIKIAKLLRHEAASGVLLFAAAFLALILCNSPWAAAYQAFWQLPLAVHVANYVIAQPLLFWVNEGLMTLFFLLVGLELKREFLAGELQTFSHILLPAVAAVGGMVVPAILYCIINYHNDATITGWAIPVATDIAFALGVLSLFGKRVPRALKLFLLALAIFDDVGAILIIAFFHSGSLSWWSLGLSAVAISVLLLFNKSGVRRLSLYLLVGLALWFCVLRSGVHATVAGVLLAFTIPLRANGETRAPAYRLEDSLHSWVMYVVMPLFAFANAGVSLQGLSGHILLDSILLGTVLGLFIGKQLGVFGFSWLVIKLGWAKMPANTSWRQLYGTAVLCGIGFTMSLFLGTLTFENNNPEFMVQVRLGVLIASVLAGGVGALVLQKAFLRKRT